MERILRSPFVMMAMLISIGVVYVGVEEQWAFELFLYPVIIFFVTYLGLLIYHNKKYPNKKINIITYIPYELREEDEGMQWATYKATRKVYIFYYFAIPASIVFVTILHTVIPYIAIWILVVLGVIQYFIYWYEMRTLLKEGDEEC
ncbi:hypothetical protein ACLIBH_02015 [Virgibacillus sp. W0430]|uniref:hypothetical protein n=1 Tax=Virgibacillus sp. W0430 TaxID=3391580 RepID=UPI003F45827C